jgi:hypothetical protein
MNAHAKLLIAAIALGAVSQYAQAEALPYKDIKLCKGVTLQNDSAKQWGCWTQFASPAAGPTPVGYLGMPGSEPYLPTVNPTQPTTGSSCAAGAMCGYAVYMNLFASEGYYGQDKPSISWYPESDYFSPAHFTVNPQGTQPDGVTPTALNFQLQQINAGDPTPYFANSSLLPLFASFGPVSYYRTSSSNGLSYTYWAPVKGTQMVVGSAAIYDYIGGTGTGSLFVTGVPTSSADLTHLATNNLSATYTGSELISGAAVQIKAYFGQGNWNGSWGAGTAGAWQAGGSITGGNIQSTAISGAYNAGQVQGAFYGSNAQALGGVADVSNTTSGLRHVDVFATIKN